MAVLVVGGRICRNPVGGVALPIAGQNLRRNEDIKKSLYSNAAPDRGLWHRAALPNARGNVRSWGRTGLSADKLLCPILTHN